MLVVITPSKNEANDLNMLAKTMLKQMLTPIIWVIVDDGSEDRTPEIVQRLCNKHDFIKYLRVDERSEYNIERYPYLVRWGIDYALKKADSEIKYISIVDADVSLNSDYFQEIIRCMKCDRDIGVASGIMYELTNENLVVRKNMWGEHILGSAALVIRRECYESVGGFPCTPAPDMVFKIKALKRGWKAKVVTTTKFVHRRSQDYCKRYRKFGEEYAMLGVHPLHSILIGIYFMYKKSYLGLAFILGYLITYLSLKRINDFEVFNYYRHEAFSNLIRRIKTKLFCG